MATNLISALKLYDQRRYQLAVWNTVMETLASQYLSSAGQEVQGRIVAEGCSKQYVPEDVVQDVVDFIQANHVDPLLREIKRIENLVVPVEETIHGETGEAAEVEVPLVRAEKPKGIRQINRPTLRKPQQDRAVVVDDVPESEGAGEVDGDAG